MIHLPLNFKGNLEKTNSNILEACNDLFLHQGIKSVSLDEISRAANTSKKELYCLYENKEGVIKAWIDYDLSLIEEKNSHFVETKKDAIAEIFASTQYLADRFRNISPILFFDLTKYHKPIFDYMIKTQMEVCFRCIGGNLHRGIEEGFYRPEIDIDVVSRVWFSKNLLLQNSTLFPLTEYSFQTLLLQFMELHIRSISTQKGLELLIEQINQKNDDNK